MMDKCTGVANGKFSRSIIGMGNISLAFRSFLIKPTVSHVMFLFSA